MMKTQEKIITLILSLFILINSVGIVSVSANDSDTYKGTGTTKTSYTYTSKPKSGTGNTYDVYKGYFSYPSATAATAEEKDLSSVFYYSDGYFFSDSTVYDEHLSSMSLALAMTGFSSNNGNKDKDGTYSYLYRSTDVKKMYTDLGIDDDDIYLSDTYTTRMTGTTIAYALGYKEISSTPNGDKDTILMPIVIRGTGYEREWYSNMSIGENGEHEGFGSAADTVYAGVQKYVSEHQEKWAGKTVKYWVVGYSRAAGVANLTGRRIVDGLKSNENVYTYTFGTPKGGTQSFVDAASSAGYNYNCIHNIVNAADVIIVFAPSDMGFIRYGLDHYVPGSTETNKTNSDSKSWTFNGSTITPASTIYDNTIWNMNSNEYASQKEKMLKQLAAIDYCDVNDENATCVYKEFIEADNKGFVAAKFNIFNVLSGGSYLQEFKDREGYKDAELTLEQFLVLFVRYIEAFGLYNDKSQPSSTDTLRDLMASYQTDVSSLSPDEGLEVFAGYLKGMTDEESKKFSNCFSGLSSRFEVSEIFTFYINYLASYWPYQSAESRKAHLQTLWERFVTYKVTDENGETYSILGVLTGSEDENTELGIELKQSFFVMFDLLLRFIAVDNMTYTGTGANENRSDYNGDTYYRDADGKIYHVNFVENVADNEFIQEKYGLSCLIMLGTLLRNSFFLPLNHHPELTFAWVRSYDSYYENDIGQNNQIATIKYEGELTVTPTVNTSDACVYSNTDNYYGDCTLTLTPNKEGTVLLYRVNFTGEESKDNHYTTYKLYRGPIELNYKGEYKVEVKAYYLGKLLENDPTTFTYKIIDAPISINGEDVTSKVYDGSENAVAYLGAYYSVDPSLYQFINWDKCNDTDITDNKTALLLPIEAKATQARNYTATYIGKITNVNIEYTNNSSTPTITLTQVGSDTTKAPAEGTYNIAYRLDSSDDTYTYVSTVVTLYEDSNSSTYYSSRVTGSITNPNGSGEATSDTTVKYSSTDGSVTLERQYKYSTSTITNNFYKVTVDYFDENNSDVAIANQEIYVMGNTRDITIAAKEIEDEKFSAWKNSDGSEVSSGVSGNKITLTSKTETSIKAYYKPVVTSVSGEVALLEVGKEFPSSITSGVASIPKYGNGSLNITGSITWEKYDTGSKTWIVNTDTVAQANTGYRATITPSFNDTSISYAISENLSATINNKSLSNVDITLDENGKPTLKVIMATYAQSEDDKSLVLVYDNDIKTLDRATYNSGSAIQSKLSETTVKVLLADGSIVDASVSWNFNPSNYKSSNDDQIIAVEGTVTGYDFSTVSKTTTQKFIIKGITAKKSPIASIDSGTYNYSIGVTLTSAENGEIYYTLDSNAQDDLSKWTKYNGEKINFSYTGKKGENTGELEPQILMAYVKGDGINTKDSDIVTFIYTITNNSSGHKTCEEALGKNWHWSMKTNSCVYRVDNTSSK